MRWMNSRACNPGFQRIRELQKELRASLNDSDRWCNYKTLCLKNDFESDKEIEEENPT